MGERRDFLFQKVVGHMEYDQHGFANLVGRNQELTKLGAFLESAIMGKQNDNLFVILSGSTGTGKVCVCVLLQ